MQKSPGFTIVEIIIVCVVVAILASIGIVSWSATLRNSRDDVRASEHKDWAKRFETFRSKNTVYPNANDSGVAITGEHCLGTGFPSGRCKGGGSYHRKRNQYNHAAACKSRYTSDLQAHGRSWLRRTMGTIHNRHTRSDSGVSFIRKHRLPHWHHKRHILRRSYNMLYRVHKN